MARLVRLAAILLCFLAARSAYGATYYIDCAGGSDSNNGTSKATPWQHAPGMVGFSAIYTHAAGDHFVFKGGVVCPVGTLPLTISYGGAAGNIDTYGATDQTWYTGGSWTRVIFDGGGTGPVGHNMIEGANRAYYAIDSIEFRNQAVPNTSVLSQGAINATGSAHDVTINNIYVHSWSFTGGCASNADTGKVGGVNFNGTNMVLQNSTFDGSNTGGSGQVSGVVLNVTSRDTGTHFGPGNVVHNMSNGVLASGGILVFGNTFYNMVHSCDPVAHGNVIEWFGPGYTFNNVIHDSGGGGITIFTWPSSSTQPDYVYNNVFYNNSTVNITVETTGGATSGTEYIYNNTMQVGAGSMLVRVNLRNSRLGTLIVRNNHFINASGSTATDGSGAVCYNRSGTCDPVTTYTETNSVNQTNSAASSQGYTSSETYPYSPNSPSDSTVGTGTNLASLCGAPLASLCSDILSVARPTTGAWSVGAYEVPQSSVAQPDAPTNLTASVQ